MSTIGPINREELVLIGFVYQAPDMEPDAFLCFRHSGCDPTEFIPEPVLFHLTEELDPTDPRGQLHAMERLALVAELKLIRSGKHFPHLLKQLRQFRSELSMDFAVAP